MSPERILIDGDTLCLEEIAQVADGGVLVQLAPHALLRVQAARARVEAVAAGDKPVYGINTGFGSMAEVRIDRAQLQALQRNFLRSHAAGVGDALPEREARALLLLRCNVLAKGNSGVRPEVLTLGLEMLNRGVTPLVPERGSVGASGDLAPLAHLALTFTGEGEARFQGADLPAAEALRRAGLTPLALEAKEGLALVNGTQAMGAVGTLALLEAEALAELADVTGAMTVEAMLGSHRPFSPLIQDVRPHPGQRACAAHLRSLLVGSQLVESHVDCKKVQDAYSLRCMPQVHGAARDGMTYVRNVLSVEINAATDNPLVFPEANEIISGGNFHGQPLALALDVLAMTLTQLSAISERRVEQLVNPNLSGLPALLTRHSGLQSGLAMAQVTAAALVAESRILCHPASVDSIPTWGGREDHVSMGMTAALKARRVVANVATGLAIELLVAAQALEFRLPTRPGRGVEAAHALVRQHIPPLEDDRILSHDIAAARRLVTSGQLLAAVRTATGAAI